MEELFEKLNNIIKQYDSIIIMGHKDPDLDSLGSCLGLYEIIENFQKNVYIILNVKKMNNYNFNVNQSLEKLSKNINFIDKNDIKNINEKSLLIILDTHISDRVELKEAIDNFDTIVLDHHIKSKNYIKNTKFFYIDSNLSSMSELITFYSFYLGVDLDNVISTILLGGIEIDTTGFNVKTTNKTYEAASILMEMGADSILKQELLKETKEEYIKRASYIRNSFLVKDKIAMCILPKEVTSLELAEVAEELLTFEDIEVSFSIGRLSGDLVGVSARSLGNYNVSEIISKMGGGGHLTNAATQIKDKTIKEIKNDIINYLENSNLE